MLRISLSLRGPIYTAGYLEIKRYSLDTQCIRNRNISVYKAQREILFDGAHCATALQHYIIT